MEVPLVIESTILHEPLLITSHTYCHFPDGLDYSLMDTTVTIPAHSLEECFSVEIKNDTHFEDTEENFFVDLSYTGTYPVALEINRTEIKIIDDDGTPGF